MPRNHTSTFLFALACFQLAPVAGQAAPRNRIVGPIDNRTRVQLRGNVHPKARAEDDQGSVDTSLTLPYVTMVLKPSDAQQADLEQLLAQQQDPSSPNYHHWLTPDEYANRFGVSQDDLQKVTGWLAQQHLTVLGTARARNWVAFRGAAGDMQTAFGIRLHHFLVDGKMHFANTTEPTIPAAFSAVVNGLQGLTDFRLRPPKRLAQALPHYDSSKGSHYLAPGDFAAIYNVQPLYDAGFDGSGQSVVVVGQTRIDLSDIDQYRTFFGLSTNDPKTVLVPSDIDPGVVQDDLGEADLDVELSGGVAPNANIIYVYSSDVITSLQYAIDQNLAPVLSMSYGSCEALTPSSDARNMQGLARQANAQGMTFIAASGDSGGADCVGSSSRNSFGLSVDIPAGIPEVTGIGGTEFNEGSGNYWNTSNNAARASVLSYVPETAWNDSAQDGSPSSSGGGASVMFSKPSWQSGVGVPSDGARDVPDISLSGSADHDGYLIYSGGSLQVIGGTSVGAPSFAGITAILNQYLVNKGAQASAGLGNVNPRLYSLAQSASSAFHDITTGDNMVNPCPSRARACTPTPVGFSAGTGYDQVTGLGSIDAFALVTAWAGGSGSGNIRGTAAIAASSNAGTIAPADSTLLIATVRGANGGTPSGTVSFLLGGVNLGTSTLAGSGGTATATLTVNGSQLSVGTQTITAQYSGDSSYNGATASLTVTVTAVTSSGPPSITSMANGASFRSGFAPGMILTVFGSQLAPVSAAATGVPLPAKLAGVSVTINGVAAPLYYISPGQLNLQIPYETPTNLTVQLTVTNNGQSASTSFRAAAAAPGIFTNTNGAPVPNTTAARSQVASLYITGDGAVSPSLATGVSPASGTAVSSLPKPRQNVSVTVDGVPATIQFIGITPGLVGVTQINYQIPAQAPAGSQAVVVTVGGVASQSATLTVTP